MPRLPVPTRGTANATTVTDQPSDFTPPGGEKNVLVFTPNDGRPQVGQRPGLSKVVPAQLGTPENRRVQALAAISRASAVTSYVLGQQTPLVGTGKRSGLTGANILILKAGKTGTIDTLTIDGSGGAARGQAGSARASTPITLAAGIGFPSTATPTWAVMHPSNTLAAVGFAYTDTGTNKVLVVLIDPKAGTLLGVRTATPGAAGVASCAVFTGNTLLVAAGATLYRMAVSAVGSKYLPTDLEATTLAAAGLTLSSAVGSIVAMSAGLVDSTWRVYAAFTGSTTAGNTINPVATPSDASCCKSWRAGVLRIDDTDGTLATVNYGPAAARTDNYAEVTVGGDLVNHNTARLSMLLARNPRGCIPTAIAFDPVSGGCVLAITNDGWGPVTSFTPDGNRAPSTLIKLSDAGILLFETDLQSRISGEAGGKRASVGTAYACDVPDEDGGNAGTTSKNGPAIRCVAVDSGGLIYAAGRISSGRFNVWCCDASAGTLRWRERTESRNITAPAADGTPEAWKAAGDAGGGTVRGGLAVDLTNSVAYFTGRRNRTNRDADAYANQQYASVFRFSSADGTPEWAWSATQDSSNAEAVSCIAAGDGVLVLGTTPFADPGT